MFTELKTGREQKWWLGWESFIPEQGIADETENEQNKDNDDYKASVKEVCAAMTNSYKTNKYLQIKLLYYLQKFIYGKTGYNVLNGHNAADFLSAAITKILECKRQWKPNRIPNIVHFIIMTAISDIRHEMDKIDKIQQQHFTDNLLTEDIITDKSQPGNKKRNRPKPLIIPLYGSDSNEGTSSNTIPDIHYAKQNFVKSRELYDECTDFEDMVTKIETALKGDENTFCVFQKRIDGEKSNKKIAADLGITERKVENALKKIKRLLIKLDFK
jgi:hypothetical protein